jgi:hypothetical protein
MGAVRDQNRRDDNFEPVDHSHDLQGESRIL